MPAPSSRTRARASTPSNTCGVAGRRTKRSSRGSVLPSGFATTTSRPDRQPAARSRARDSTPREPRDGASARLLGAAAAGGRKHRGACAGPLRLGSAPRSHASERRAGAHRGTPRDAGRSNPRAFRRSRGQRAGASALYARAGPAAEQGLRRVWGRLRIALCDVVFTMSAIRRGSLDWDYILATARRHGALAGLGCYLSYVDQIHRDVFWQPLVAEPMRGVLGLRGWGRVEFHEDGYRFPIARVNSRLYVRQLGGRIAARDWTGAARLFLIP